MGNASETQWSNQGGGLGSSPQENLKVHDLKWCILMHFGTKYIKAQLCIILYDCGWNLLFGVLEGRFWRNLYVWRWNLVSLGKVVRKFENLDQKQCILLHLAKNILQLKSVLSSLYNWGLVSFLKEGFGKIWNSRLEVFAFWLILSKRKYIKAQICIIKPLFGGKVWENLKIQT